MSGVSQSNVNSYDYSNDPPLVAIETIDTQGSIISNLTHIFLVTNGEIEPVFLHSDIGLPKTPPCRILFSPSEHDLSEGYDSIN